MRRTFGLSLLAARCVLAVTAHAQKAVVTNPTLSRFYKSQRRG